VHEPIELLFGVEWGRLRWDQVPKGKRGIREVFVLIGVNSIGLFLGNVFDSCVKS